MEKVLEFCTWYSSNVKAVKIPRQKFSGDPERPLSSGVVTTINRDILKQTHLYVLKNNVEVDPYIE